MFRFSRKFLFVVVFSLVIGACGGTSEEDVAATVAASLSATQTAVPTATPVPPTNTPIPTDTPTPVPTDTPAPTDTPVPTDTPEPTLTPTPEPGIVETLLESGDTVYEVTQSGFSLTLPPEWVAVDITSKDFSAAFDAVGEQNEALSFLSTDYAQSLVASGMKFYALNIGSDSLGSGNPFSMNVIVNEISVDLPIDQYAALTVGQLEQMFDLEDQIEQTPVTIDNEEAMRLFYTVKLVNAIGIPVEISTTQYLMVRDGNMYVVSMSILAEYAEQYGESMRAAAETFRFVESGE